MRCGQILIALWGPGLASAAMDGFIPLLLVIAISIATIVVVAVFIADDSV